MLWWTGDIVGFVTRIAELHTGRTGRQVDAEMIPLAGFESITTRSGTTTTAHRHTIVADRTIGGFGREGNAEVIAQALLFAIVRHCDLAGGQTMLDVARGRFELTTSLRTGTGSITDTGFGR